MPRAERSFIPYEMYHVGSRASDDGIAFGCDLDRHDFLTRLTEIVRTHRWTVLAWCVLSTHYHLLLYIVEDNVSDGMKILNGGYSLAANKRDRRRSHRWENRFFAKHVETDEHAVGSMRYIDRNPCEAGLVDDPVDWPWSSHRALIGVAKPEPFHGVERALQLLRVPRSRAHAAYREFVIQGDPRCQTPVEVSGAIVTKA